MVTPDGHFATGKYQDCANSPNTSSIIDTCNQDPYCAGFIVRTEANGTFFACPLTNAVPDFLGNTGRPTCVYAKGV